MDPNVHGVRRVVEERSGKIVSMIHIAIPLGYQRKQLAQTIRLEQIDDDQATPRVNLASSNGFDEPHSYIRVPLQDVIERFNAFLRSSTPGGEINDETLGTSPNVLAVHEPAARHRRRGDDHRLRAAVRHALAMRKAVIDRHHIQTLVDKRTREKWIRIRNVDKSVRQALRLAIKEAGIRTASPPPDRDTEWAILFTTSEANKLLT